MQQNIFCPFANQLLQIHLLVLLPILYAVPECQEIQLIRAFVVCYRKWFLIQDSKKFREKIIHIQYEFAFLLNYLRKHAHVYKFHRAEAQ